MKLVRISVKDTKTSMDDNQRYESTICVPDDWRIENLLQVFGLTAIVEDDGFTSRHLNAGEIKPSLRATYRFFTADGRLFHSRTVQSVIDSFLKKGPVAIINEADFVSREGDFFSRFR